MRKLLLLSVLALAFPVGASAADKGQCDAKPFKLTKPKTTQTAQAKPKTAAPKSKKQAPASTPDANKPAQKSDPAPLVGGCKEPKGK